MLWPCRDVIERPEKGSELKTDVATLYSLFMEAFDAVFIFAGDGVVADANLAAERLTGYPRDELIGLNVFDLFPPDERIKARQLLNTMLSVGVVKTVSGSHLKRKDGALVPVDVNAKVVSVGGRAYIVGIARDVTERQRIEDELRERVARSEAANEISRLITSTLELPEVLRLVVNEISKAIGTEAGGIFFYRPDESKFYGKMGYGLAQEHVKDLVLDAETFGVGYEAVQRSAPVLIEDVEADSRIARRFIDMFGLRTVLILPLIVKDNVIGIVALGHTDPVHAFNPDQIAFAEGIAAQSAVAIENARLYEQQRYVADILQRSLLPESILEIPDTEIAVFYTAASEVARVGGDFYDVFELADGLAGLLIGDVSGKGIEAASTTALGKYTMRAFAYQSVRASTVVEMANNAIAHELEPGNFITLAYLLYDWRTGRLVFSNAGHPYPVHYAAATGDAWFIENNNTALGILPGFDYSEVTEELAPGDALVLYTDGLIEARSGAAFYGTDRLLTVIRRTAHHPAPEVIRLIIDDVYAFTEGKLIDDIAVMVLKRTSGKSKSR